MTTTLIPTWPQMGGGGEVGEESSWESGRKPGRGGEVENLGDGGFDYVGKEPKLAHYPYPNPNHFPYPNSLSTLISTHNPSHTSNAAQV